MLSIIAVVIDNLEVTKRFISSIRQYTEGRYELILVDNGSADPKAIKYFKDNADAYFRFPKIVSLSRAWNQGVALAKGSIIAVVNNDTVVPPRWYGHLKETLLQNKKAGMVTPMTYWLMQGHFKYALLKKFNKKFDKPFSLIPFKEVVYGEFCVYKREALEKVGGFNEIYERAHYEDLEMVFSLFKAGFKVYVDPRVFVYHQGNASHIPGIMSKKEWGTYEKQNFDIFVKRWPEHTKNWK